MEARMRKHRGLPHAVAFFVLFIAGICNAAEDAGTRPSNPSNLPDERNVAPEPDDAGAQNRLGVRYYLGKGVSQDYEEAVSWYRKAAEQGYAVAQKNNRGR